MPKIIIEDENQNKIKYFNHGKRKINIKSIGISIGWMRIVHSANRTNNE